MTYRFTATCTIDRLGTTEGTNISTTSFRQLYKAVVQNMRFDWHTEKFTCFSTGTL